MKRNTFTHALLLLLIGLSVTVQAQTIERPQPKFWLGFSGALNYNMYTGTTQIINPTVTAPAAFHEGYGLNPYGSVLMEYRPTEIFGFMLNLGYDNRGGSFYETASPCNRPENLKTSLSYATFEPSIRITPFKSGFYFYLGGAYSYNINKAFIYTFDVDPEARFNSVQGNFSEINQHVISGLVGIGYDIPLSTKSSPNQVSLSPFVSYHPYFGQHPRSVESWSLSTIRTGVALKFGKKRISSMIETNTVSKPELAQVVDPTVQFSVISPDNIPVKRRVRETFPLRNYIFFDKNSNEIPERYVLLKKSDVKNFNETQLEVFTPKNLSGRSDRGMTAYYNILNILGDRMNQHAATNIKLVGSSENGPQEGRIMAEAVKIYLTDVFEIAPNRVEIEGRNKPKIPSEQPGGLLELELLRQGDRRVSVESNSPELLMEFQSGEEAPLKSVEINSVQDAPLDSYVIVEAKGSNIAFSSWNLDIIDMEGTIQHYGPYNQEQIHISGKSILGKKKNGNYKFKMIGNTKSGKKVEQVIQKQLVLWTPETDEQGMRYSVIYEFNNSKSIKMYHKYLSEVVSPKIPRNATVIVHGHTDAIGDSITNKNLSLARANDVKNILENALTEKGRTDVKFDLFGFGEETTSAPYGNKLPEERFYNRTVIIDIIPKN